MTAISNDVHTTSTASASPVPNKSDNLGQADFLRLMTEQLKHQDPLKPMENSEFLGQLAQFSTVQGINNMQGIMKGLSESMLGDQILRGATLVGREVLVPSEKVALEEGGNPVTGAVAATAPGSIKFDIKDSNGQLVRTIVVKAEKAGEVGFSWDGTGANGKHLAAGQYSITATQTSASDGAKSELSTYINANVESVSVGSDGLYLNLKGLGTAPIGYVLRIS